MRKIIVGAMVSIDGIMQAPGGPTEDPTKGFKFGGWVMPHFDREFGEEIDRLFKAQFDLLLGRKTYEIFAAYWPYYDDSGPDGRCRARRRQEAVRRRLGATRVQADRLARFLLGRHDRAVRARWPNQDRRYGDGHTERG